MEHIQRAVDDETKLKYTNYDLSRHNFPTPVLAKNEHVVTKRETSLTSNLSPYRKGGGKHA